MPKTTDGKAIGAGIIKEKIAKIVSLIDSSDFRQVTMGSLVKLKEQHNKYPPNSPILIFDDTEMKLQGLILTNNRFYEPQGELPCNCPACETFYLEITDKDKENFLQNLQNVVNIGNQGVSKCLWEILKVRT